jgi:multidrug resistance efflux pump
MHASTLAERMETQVMSSHSRLAETSTTLQITIAAQTRTARTWSVSGFTLDQPVLGLKTRDIRPAEVQVSMSGFSIRFSIPCQVLVADEMGGREFKFLGAFSEQSRLLHRMAEDQQAGHATQLQALLASPVPARTQAKRRRLALAVPLALLGASVAVLSTAVLTSLFTVRSQAAAVTVEGMVLRAPATGTIVGPLPPPGAEVKKGEPLYQVMTADVMVRIADLSAELTRLTTLVDYWHARRAQLATLTKKLGELNAQKMESIKEKLAALDSQLAIYSTLVRKRDELAGKGLATQFAADMQRIDLEQSRKDRETAQSELATINAQGELLKSGILSLQWGGATESAESLDLKVAEMEAMLAKAQETLDVISRSTQISSPCDCVVYARAAKAGEVVESGAPVYSLRTNDSALMVEALFSADDTTGLTIGSAATVSLPKGRVTGRLEALSYEDPQGARLGLFSLTQVGTASAAGEPRFVRATIALPDLISPAEVGAPAEVAIRSNPLRRTFNRVFALQS